MSQQASSWLSKLEIASFVCLSIRKPRNNQNLKINFRIFKKVFERAKENPTDLWNEIQYRTEINIEPNELFGETLSISKKQENRNHKINTMNRWPPWYCWHRSVDDIVMLVILVGQYRHQHIQIFANTFRL